MSSNRTRIDRWLLVLVVVGSALRLAAVHLSAARRGWILVGDNAVIVERSSDLWSRQLPLIGMPSGFSAWSSAADPFHPGPLPLWFLGLGTATFGNGEGVVLFMTWLLAVVSVVVVAHAAWKLAGVKTAMVAVVLCAITTGWLTAPPWTPLTLVLAARPLFACCFLTWGLAAGRPGYWPAWILFASLCVQADLSYAPSVTALGVAGIIGTAAAIRRERAVDDSSLLGRWVVGASVGAIVLAWAAPMVDALANNGGNIGELLRAARADVPVAGLRGGAGAVGDLLGRAQTIASLPPAIHLAAGAGLALLVVLGWRCGRQGRRPLAATAAAASMGALAAQALTPTTVEDSPSYDHPLTMTAGFVLFALAVLAWDGLVDLSRPQGAASQDGGAGRWAAEIVALAAAAVLVLTLPGATVAEVIYLQPQRAGLEAVADQLETNLAEGSYRWQPLSGPDGTALLHGLVLKLDSTRIDSRVDAGLVKYYGPQHSSAGDEDGTLYLTLDAGPAPVPGAQMVASWSAGETAEASRAEGRVAVALRASSLRPEPALKEYQLGTLLATYGLADDHPQLAVAEFESLGARFVEAPARFGQLTDEELVDLVVRDGLERPAALDDLGPELELLKQRAHIRVWFAPA